MKNANGVDGFHPNQVGSILYKWLGKNLMVEGRVGKVISVDHVDKKCMVELSDPHEIIKMSVVEISVVETA